jgi:hypothetical protein
VRRAIQNALAGLGALGLAACAGPLYYGDRGAQAGAYVPVQSPQPTASQGGYGGTASDPSTGAWAPELRGAAERAQAGGAWAGSGGQAAGSGSRVIQPGASGVSAPRYGDGGPVRNDPWGSTTALDAPARQLEPGGSGRSLLLQEYQAVLEERDALRLEVDALSNQMQMFQLRITELQEELQGGDMRTVGLEQELDGLRRRVDEVEAENEDLAARLTTAQIRRLEAEKDLIQVLIDNRAGRRTSVDMPASASLSGMPGNEGAGAARPTGTAGASATGNGGYPATNAGRPGAGSGGNAWSGSGGNGAGSASGQGGR